jgi:hypothetical protein
MLNVLKCFSSIGAVIMLFVGFAFTGITVYAWLNQDVFLSDEDIKDNILISMIIVSSVVVIVSILGIIGVVRRNCCLIFVYQLFLVVFLALFVAVGVGSELIKDKVFDGDCRNSTNPLVSSANILYEKSDQYFCKSYCQCSMTSTALSKYSVS